MPGDLLYANAQIIMKSDAELLTRKRIREMAAATDRPSLLRVLAECHYQTDFEDDTTIVETERQKTLQTFLELCADDALATCVRTLDQMTETTAIADFATIAAQIPHIKAPSIREYFTTLADLTNVRTYQKGGNTWVAGGKIPVGKALKNQPDLTPRLDELAAVDHDDIFKINPLFWWYLQKQKELVVVKTILICKRFNYDAAFIRESLRGLYEQFK